jgi:hypothetical protein
MRRTSAQRRRATRLTRCVGRIASDRAVAPPRAVPHAPRPSRRSEGRLCGGSAWSTPRGAAAHGSSVRDGDRRRSRHCATGETNDVRGSAAGRSRLGRASVDAWVTDTAVAAAERRRGRKACMRRTGAAPRSVVGASARWPADTLVAPRRRRRRAACRRGRRRRAVPRGTFRRVFHVEQLVPLTGHRHEKPHVRALSCQV